MQRGLSLIAALLGASAVTAEPAYATDYCTVTVVIRSPVYREFEYDVPCIDPLAGFAHGKRIVLPPDDLMLG